MARLTSNIGHESFARQRISTPILGPMIDNGAPCSLIGQVEMLDLSSLIISKTEFSDLEPMPEAFGNRTLRQYGVGAHTSDERPIIGSVMIKFNAGDETVLKGWQLVLLGL